MVRKGGETCCFTAGLLLVVLGIIGCDNVPPPPTDPAKAPWLLDPQSQIEGLKNGDVRIRGISAFNLGNMGAKATGAIPELEKLAKEDANLKVRENAREALKKIRAAAGSSSE
jgi:RecB family exonuclease